MMNEDIIMQDGLLQRFGVEGGGGSEAKWSDFLTMGNNTQEG